jgi:hypothetical protein
MHAYFRYVCSFHYACFPFCLFRYVSDGGRPRIENRSSPAKNLRGREGVQSKDATSVETCQCSKKWRIDREPGGPGSRMARRDVMSHPSPRDMTRLRSQELHREEKMFYAHGMRRMGPVALNYVLFVLFLIFELGAFGDLGL